MRPSEGRINLWPLAVTGVIVILAVASITPVMRLNSAPPPDFVALRATAKGPNATEAQRYWDVAVQVIQWRYDRTSALPVQVPAEFKPGDGKTDGEASPRYWAKLRQEWLVSDNWHKTITFDMSWILHDVQSLWGWLSNFFRNHS